MAVNLHGMFARRLAAVAVFMVVTAASAYAQQAAGDIIVAWGERLKRFLSVLMGIAALVSIAFSIYYMLNGKSEAAKKLVFTFIGLAIGSALMAAMANFAGSTSVSGGAGGFEGVKAEVKAVLQGALAIVAMIALTSLTIKMIDGEEQAYRRLFVWVVASVVGSAMLSAV